MSYVIEYLKEKYFTLLTVEIMVKEGKRIKNEKHLSQLDENIEM